jgi:hypothetical protein
MALSVSMSITTYGTYMRHDDRAVISDWCESLNLWKTHTFGLLDLH